MVITHKNIAAALHKVPMHAQSLTVMKHNGQWIITVTLLPALIGAQAI